MLEIQGFPKKFIASFYRKATVTLRMLVTESLYYQLILSPISVNNIGVALEILKLRFEQLSGRVNITIDGEKFSTFDQSFEVKLTGSTVTTVSLSYFELDLESSFSSFFRDNCHIIV